MELYHNALAANNAGLPEFSGLPLLDWIEPTNSNAPLVLGVPGLTPGGAVIARRVKVSASVANLMAEVAGIGKGAVHA